RTRAYRLAASPLATEAQRRVRQWSPDPQEGCRAWITVAPSSTQLADHFGRLWRLRSVRECADSLNRPREISPGQFDRHHAGPTMVLFRGEPVQGGRVD